jgi:hypothetical protein
MSTRAGGRHRPHPDSPTGYNCGWMLCVTPVPYRFWRENIYLCQDHALATWAAVERMNKTAQGIPVRRDTKPETVEGYEGSVYYIRLGDRVKIGFSTNLFERLSTYPPNMEILLIRRGSKDLEHREHIRFSEHRTDGREWFHANDRVLQMISEITDGIDHDWEPEWFQRRTHKPQVVIHRKLKGERSGHGH